MCTRRISTRRRRRQEIISHYIFVVEILCLYPAIYLNSSKVEIDLLSVRQFTKLLQTVAYSLPLTSHVALGFHGQETLEVGLQVGCFQFQLTSMYTKYSVWHVVQLVNYVECLTNHNFILGSLAGQVDGLRSFAVWNLFDKERCVSGQATWILHSLLSGQSAKQTIYKINASKRKSSTSCSLDRLEHDTMTKKKISNISYWTNKGTTWQNRELVHWLCNRLTLIIWDPMNSNGKGIKLCVVLKLLFIFSWSLASFYLKSSP